ncbi:hypothetical protein LSTR_LSTR010479 [Laodelphax striatellus]|uniref:Ribosomal protein S21 n=1 Tax=Laodelphax striatellus TaxID=195883 RepID=A0A482X7H7_LAOST|nr:hypothetical protein LSTR_LSTR010479 [Laodelphax striatellus]
MGFRHARFVARTVLVRNGNVDEAVKNLNRYKSLFQLQVVTWFLFQLRRRINYEKCRAIYNEDMDRKIAFVMRKNRVDPFPGCI